MLVWGLLFVSGLAIVAAVAWLVWRRPRIWTASRRLDAAVQRLQAAGSAIVGPLGRPAAAIAILFAGVGATVAICWPLGRLARRFEPQIDVPLFRFAQRGHAHYWDRINDGLTLMGNRPEIKAVCLVSAVVLAVLWRRRGWWIPPVVIGVAFFAEKFGQTVLAKVADRGHPPTTLGTYPSGGCARLIAIYGAILFLVLLTLPRATRAVRFAVWTLLSLAAFVEGYTRIYLLKHWFTDVIGGWIYGSLLLGVLVAATATLVGKRAEPAPPSARRAADTELTAERHPMALSSEGGRP
jgi:membrane-associated phospholipid phosphatase